MTTAVFGVCNDDHRKITKTITSTAQRECSIYGDCDIMKPVLLVAGDVSAYNYVQCFGRSYFITGITLSPGGRSFVHCDEDVLMSNAAQILQCQAWGTRGGVYNKLLHDPDLPKLANTTTQVVNFSGEGFAKTFSGYNYLLIVKGGG